MVKLGGRTILKNSDPVMAVPGGRRVRRLARSPRVPRDGPATPEEDTAPGAVCSVGSVVLRELSEGQSIG